MDMNVYKALVTVLMHKYLTVASQVQWGLGSVNKSNARGIFHSVVSEYWKTFHCISRGRSSLKQNGRRCVWNIADGNISVNLSLFMFEDTRQFAIFSLFFSFLRHVIHWADWLKIVDLQTISQKILYCLLGSMQHCYTQYIQMIWGWPRPVDCLLDHIQAFRC